LSEHLSPPLSLYVNGLGGLNKIIFAILAQKFIDDLFLGSGVGGVGGEECD